MKSLSNISDGELAEEFNKGNPDAFTDIYERYWKRMFNHARRLLKDPERASDVVQDVFTRLLEKRGDMELKDTLAAFLFQGVRNNIINQIRHEKVMSKYVDKFLIFQQDMTWNTDETVRARELEAIINREIDELPNKMRETFNLSRNESLSYKQIAVRMNTTEGTVKKQIYYALKTLRSKITILVIVLIG